MTLVDIIINSVWFPLITGIASVLGCVLALYPIQIHPLHPSEYRTLQWKKTLLIAAGIGIIISSCIQIYLKVSPKYEWIQNPSADYTIKYDNCSSMLLAPQTSETESLSTSDPGSQSSGPGPIPLLPVTPGSPTNPGLPPLSPGSTMYPPQTSCSFEVTFTPTTSFDERLASIQIITSKKRTDNSIIRSSTFSVILQGKGTVSKPHASVSIGQKVIGEGSPLFSDDDISDVSSLITKLRSDTDQSTKPISQFIWAELDITTKQSLTNLKSTLPELRSALVQALNEIVKGNSIYELSRFNRVLLRPETQSLLMQNSTDIRLNRHLLEDVYPLEIVGHQIRIQLSTDKIDFGTQLIGATSRPQKITFTNIGDTALKISEIYLIGNSLMGVPSFELTAYFIFLNGEIWSILFLLGMIILILGIVSDPIKLITERLLLEQKKIEEIQSKCLKEIIGNETYEGLSTHKKNEYDQTMEYYTNLQNVIMEMLTGFSRNFSRMEIMMARNNRSGY